LRTCPKDTGLVSLFKQKLDKQLLLIVLLVLKITGSFAIY
jgi:hypothetical protein